MSGPRRGISAGVTFLLGFGAVLWLGSAALGELQGPRAQLMRELNTLRAGSQLPALRSDRHLGRVAQQHAESLARGSSVAAASGPSELERAARGGGWRGTGPVSELRLRAADPGIGLRSAPEPRDPLARRAGVGLSRAADGGFVTVVLLAR